MVQMDSESLTFWVVCLLSCLYYRRLSRPLSFLLSLLCSPHLSHSSSPSSRILPSLVLGHRPSISPSPSADCSHCSRQMSPC